jgi:four helix bundle protein
MAFEDLDVWKKSSRLSVNIYKEFNSFKDYGFKDQITRAGLSISCNWNRYWVHKRKNR